MTDGDVTYTRNGKLQHCHYGKRTRTNIYIESVAAWVGLDGDWPFPNIPLTDEEREIIDAQRKTK